jgi:alkylhydroperoxidase family enzyme
MAEAIIRDWRTAPVSERLQATFTFIEKLTDTPDEVGPEDITKLREYGLGSEEIEDAIYICVAFSIIDRLADAFGFEIPDQEQMRKTSKFLLRLGYRV